MTLWVVHTPFLSRLGEQYACGDESVRWPTNAPTTTKFSNNISNNASTNAYNNSTLLTLDPTRPTQTTSGDGRLPSPHLSPNAYFLQESDEHAMTSTTASSHTSSSNANNAYDGSSTTKNSRTTTSVSTSKSASTSQRALLRTEDDFDPDLETELSDDSGDDSADSDFFELSVACARRERSSHPAMAGGGGAPRRAGASASVPRQQVLSVRRYWHDGVRINANARSAQIHRGWREHQSQQHLR
ncbi:hypothetical protein MVEN_02184300 [Mycena venus]|uniref:Uncharacterized protein n=1 Tax=Mycena venus TaxID=2733690 RepID=A0A8H7CI90_9AGAR|nr:hypothetical protein MVEN_02184300 [Mycena venus]